jgi:hypothetical protein
MHTFNQSEILTDLAALRRSQVQLELYTTNKISVVSVCFFCEIDGVRRFVSINQDDIPFSLSGELQLLMLDSIAELQRQIDSLTQQLK